jgi:MFS family permease
MSTVPSTSTGQSGQSGQSGQTGQQSVPPALTAVALATLLVGVVLPTVDFFIVNVTLPTMARDLDASEGMLELVVAGYGVAYAVLLVAGGRIGDARGRRRVFVWGMAAFTVTSLLCGLAPTIGTLVAARVLQGAAAAMMAPQVLSTIQATGDSSSRARALGWLGATGGLSGVVGQIVGGAMVSADVGGSGWRPVFWVNVPVGLMGMWMAVRHVPETRSPRPATPDRAGSLVLALALGALLVPLTEGRAVGWPGWSWALLAAVPLLVCGFVVAERRLERAERSPLVPPLLLRVPSLRQGLTLLFALFATFGGFMFVFTLLIQDGLGFSPVHAGLALAPMGTGFLVASLQMARLVQRHGRTVITVGALLQLAGLLGLGLTFVTAWPAVHSAVLVVPLAVLGLGQGLTMPAAMRLALSEVPLHAAGAAAGVLTTTNQVALAVGVASLGSLFLTLSAPTDLGIYHAFLVVLSIRSLAAVCVGLGSRRLPGSAH